MDPVQMAYQEYMLGGKMGTTQETSQSFLSKNRNSSSKKAKKHFGPIFKAIQSRIEEWKEMDIQVGQIIASIANLRDRICWESGRTVSVLETKKWQGNGFRDGDRFALLAEDVEMALTHDLLQHEKMVGGARALISSMAQVYDGIGRRLDEWMMLQLEEEQNHKCEVFFEKIEESYLFLGAELYRKQKIVQKIMDSCVEGILEDVTKDVAVISEHPRKVAHKCKKEWPSQGKSKLEWAAVEEILKIGSISF